MAQIIVDTSALYALLDRRDPHHQAAARFLRQQKTPGGLLLSNHVIDESMTLVKARLGVHVALQLGMRVRSSQLFETVIFGAGEEAATWRLFTRYTDKAWSYTDCACLALAQQRQIDQAFTFDHHFGQMGLRMAPG
jgi:predicted nucleic acid-binding protein